jgi:hypothetical protein
MLAQFARFASQGISRFTYLAFFVALVTTLAWAGGDPWKTKPFAQWDNKDIERILNDSPWGKVIRVDAPWKSSGTDEESAGGDKSMRGMQPTMASPGQTSRDVGAPGGVVGANGGGQQVAQAAFLVRWVSSRTIREAAYRAAVLNGQMKEAEAEKEAAETVPSYQVLVGGSDMKPFQAVDEAALKGGVWLVTKKTKQKISFTNLQIERSADGNEVQSLVFSFPKKSATGESTIASDEKTVEFNLVFVGVRLQASFDISKMDDSQGRDL